MKSITILSAVIFLLGLSISSIAQVPYYVPSNGLVGWWPFNGNANDESGNLNNGTVNGTTLTTDRFGNVAKAYSFDGVNDNINLNTHLPNVFSASLWVNVANFKTYTVAGPNYVGSEVLSTFDNSTGFSGFRMGLDGLQVNYGKHSSSFWLPSGYGNAQAHNLISINNWCFLVATYDGNKLKYYVNGTLDTTITSSFVQNNKNIFLGARGFNVTGPNFFLDGKIDDVGIWNRALTQLEITNLYHSNNLNICNLINSATFNVPSQTTNLGFSVSCVNNNNPPNNAGTLVNVPIPLNQWSYIALTKSSTNLCNLYLNGTLIFTGNYANISYSWSKLIIGSQLSGGVYANFFNGSIDELKVSNSVRTASEILNYFNSNLPFASDANTIGLWHFDQTTGTTVNATTGPNGTMNSGTWSAGKFGNSIAYNGTSSHTDFQITTPTTNSTIEVWLKPNLIATSWPIMTYGGNSSGFIVTPFISNNNYTWSTGATGSSVTVDPSSMPYLWVSDGNCTDTVWFDSQSATIYDTVTTNITVTDTLIIDASIQGINPPNNINTIKVFPNPARDHISVDYGNYTLMSGYQLKITNSLGQQMFQTTINQQSSYIDLSNWTGNGLYFVHIIDNQGNTIDIKKIILQ